MCTNYAPPTRDALRARFDVLPPQGEWKEDVWRGYAAPIIRHSEDGARLAELGYFGLVPPWIRSVLDARKISAGTMNARSETVAEKPSFRAAWRRGHRCLVPMARFYEPDWRSGKAVRSAITLADGEAFAVAGIWSWWRDPESEVGQVTFSMLTVNADAHPFMNQLHRAGEEKRSLVIVPAANWDDWLSAGPALARVMLELYPADALRLAAAPSPPRMAKTDPEAASRRSTSA